MGMMAAVMDAVFGNGRNAIRETAEVFRVNAEAQAGRDDTAQERALRQFAEEFTKDRAGAFDRFMDGLNRVPRPALALGTIALFLSAMVSPVWFAERMAGIALVPEPLWWLLGAVVSFYFGARHQTKSQAFQKDILAAIAGAPKIAEAVKALKPDEKNGSAAAPEVTFKSSVPGRTATVPATSDNPALAEWLQSRG